MITIKLDGRKKTEQAWKTLTFPNGMYDYKRINTFVQQHTGRVDPANKDSDYIFTIYFDMTIYRVVTLIHNDYELDLSQGNFGELLGYGKSTLSGMLSERKFQISQEVLIGCICTVILSHAEQTMFQAICYTVYQQQILTLVIHFEKCRFDLSGNL